MQWGSRCICDVNSSREYVNSLGFDVREAVAQASHMVTIDQRIAYLCSCHHETHVVTLGSFYFNVPRSAMLFAAKIDATKSQAGFTSGPSQRIAVANGMG